MLFFEKLLIEKGTRLQSRLVGLRLQPLNVTLST